MRAMKIHRYLWLALAALASPSLATPPAPPPDTDLTERLAACNTCHGKHGEGMTASEYYPHLAGKPAHYLFQQLRAFRDGDRQYAQMGWLLRNMDDAYLHAIATHFAAMPPRSKAQGGNAAALPAETTQKALQLVEHGDPARGLPACKACHGSALTGLEPGVPALVGLPEDYIVAQFGGWLTGVRTARAPDCMAQIAQALDPREIRALAAWLSRQGHDEPVPPAAAGSLLLPLACADLPHAAATAVQP